MAILISSMSYCWQTSAAPVASAPPRQVAPAGLNARKLLENHYPMLAKGVNMQSWFWDAKPRNRTPQDAERYISNAELQALRQAGLTHLRVPVDPKIIMDLARPDKVSPAHLESLASSMQRALDAGLAVVVEMHPDYDFKARLSFDDRFVEDFARLWNTVAARLHQVDAHRIFFETLNEPSLDSMMLDPRQRWNEIQNRLLTSIRSAAPENTILVKGYDHDDIKSLGTFDPKSNGQPDENVVYSIHFYTPHEFTHQGAGWVPGGQYAFLHDLPYPVSRLPQDQVRRQALQFETPEARGLGLKYANGNYNAGKLDQKIGQAGRWAARNDKKLYMGEFGVYQWKVAPGDRDRWLDDVRRLCNQYGIAWSMWEYDEGFGLAKKKNDQRVFNPGVLQALGLIKENAVGSSQP